MLKQTQSPPHHGEGATPKDTTMNPSPEFNAAYASKGARSMKILHDIRDMLADEIRDMLSDMPADLSCSADPQSDYDVLSNVHADLLKAKFRLLKRKGEVTA
jgi:hypothetical protein